MIKVPKLTQEQRVRFAKYLFYHQLYPSIQKAKKATDSDYKCRSLFLHYKQDIELHGINTDEIQDIVNLYTIGEPKETHKKVEPSNQPHNLIAEHPNQPHNKVLPLVTENNPIANQTHKKVRGKQKSLTMQHYKTRLPVDMLDRLKALDGTVSEHIRQAVSQYLNLIDLKEHS